MATRSSPAKNNAAHDPALPQKKRARRRLVGAAALALAAAIILPLVLDSEPRHVRDDVQVSIPSRDTPLSDRAENGGNAAGAITPYGNNPGQGAIPESKLDRERAPLAIPEVAANEADAGTAEREASPGGAAPKADAGSGALPAAKPDARSEAKAEPKAPAKSDAKGDAKGDTKSDAKSEPKPAARAEAPAETRAEARPAPENKPLLLQAGAFSSEKAAGEQLERVRKLGVKTYTEKIKTSQGERIRVRIGPFVTREAADRARAKLKAAGIESALVAP